MLSVTSLLWKVVSKPGKAGARRESESPDGTLLAHRSRNARVDLMVPVVPMSPTFTVAG